MKEKQTVVNVPNALRQHLGQLAQVETSRDRGTKSYGFFKVWILLWLNLIVGYKPFNLRAYYEENHHFTFAEKRMICRIYFSYFSKYRTKPPGTEGSSTWGANYYKTQLQICWGSFVLWLAIVVAGIACCAQWQLCVALIVIGTALYLAIIIGNYLMSAGYFYGKKPLYQTMTSAQINALQNSLENAQHSGRYTD